MQKIHSGPAMRPSSANGIHDGGTISASPRSGFLPFGPPVSELELQHQRREDVGHGERDDREVEAADAQRREADEEPDHEAQRGRHRDRGEVAPVVVGDEDDRRVGAETDERRLAERQLPGVADHEVEPEDRDGVGDDVVDLADPERLVEREQAHRQRVREHDVEQPEGDDGPGADDVGAVAGDPWRSVTSAIRRARSAWSRTARSV